MKNLFENIPEVRQRIERAGGVFLLLDFDGVLSEIAPTPDEAILSDGNRELLKHCNQLFPVAVITGRTLAEIKKKVKVEGLLYIASHGLEWEEDGKYHVKQIPKKIIDAVNLAKQKISPLLSHYPGMVFEDKSFMLGVHYRIMNPSIVGRFKSEIRRLLNPILERGWLRLDHNKKTFELRPDINWDKGDSALFAENYFKRKTGKKFASIYIGDGLTDEDAFRALKNGITIRVRPKKVSAAKYYFKSRKQVDEFLRWLVMLIPHKK